MLSPLAPGISVQAPAVCPRSTQRGKAATDLREAFGDDRRASRRLQFCLKGSLLGKPAYLHDGKPRDAPALINTLHDGSILDLPHEAGLVREAHFQEVRLGIEPDS